MLVFFFFQINTLALEVTHCFIAVVKQMQLIQKQRGSTRAKRMCKEQTGIAGILFTIRFGFAHVDFKKKKDGQK